ncbi:hypothetical protein [Streptomyces sp. NPDC090021]|uniref:hypothetical protein n=1 Tax=Streptomyces sp. NPDC090021 TaxID=3365919 RepID=UPI00381B7520
MDEDAETLALLRALDRLPGPDHLEYPHGFDYEAARARATRLGDRLTHDFGSTWGLDEGIQDASYSFLLRLPAERPGPVCPWPCGSATSVTWRW